MAVPRGQDRKMVLPQLLRVSCRVKRAMGRDYQKQKTKQREQESHMNKPEEHVQGSSVGFRWLRIQFVQIPTKRVQNLVVAFVAWTDLSRPRCKAYQITRAEGQIDVLMGTALRWHRRKLDGAGQRPWGCLLWHLKVEAGRNSAWLSILWGVSLSK